LDTPDERPPLAAHEGQLGQVLSNLTDNAIKYSAYGGTVLVGIRWSDRDVRFFVADSGLGVPPNEQRRIFEECFRLGADMPPGIGGTGLGLYICRELV